MNENVRGNGGHKFLMFALGTTAGAVVALLTAPGSGKETRRRLRNSLQQVREKASTVSGSLADSFGRGTETLRDGIVKGFDKEPASTSHFSPATAPSRAGQSHTSSSTK